MSVSRNWGQLVTYVVYVHFDLISFDSIRQGDVMVVPQKTVTNALPVITSVNNGDWSINPTERAKYDQLFDSLQPSNGYISGNKVKGVLMDSKLPLDTLGKIWDLADMDKDGMLDRHEFVVVSIIYTFSFMPLCFCIIYRYR